MEHKTKKRGQALVEMAFVLPLFLVMLLGIYDFGIALHTWSSLNTQCVEASRAGAKRNNQLVARGVFGSNTHANLTAVTTAFWNLRSPLMPTTSYLSGSPIVQGVGIAGNSTVTVSAGYNVTLITPIISTFFGSGGSGQLTINAVATANKE